MDGTKGTAKPDNGDADESPATAKNPGKTDQKVDGTADTVVKTDGQANDKPDDQISKKVDGTAGTAEPDNEVKDGSANASNLKK